MKLNILVVADYGVDKLGQPIKQLLEVIDGVEQFDFTRPVVATDMIHLITRSVKIAREREQHIREQANRDADASSPPERPKE